MQNLGLIGLIIVLAATTRWFWRAWAVNVPKTPLLFQALLGLGLILGAISLYLGQGDVFAPFAIGLAVLLLYLTATGAQKVDDEMINVGDMMPAFSALDDQENAFDSSSLAGSRILLKFFRGHW